MHNVLKQQKNETTIHHYYYYAPAVYLGRGSENVCHHYWRVKL